VESQKTTQGFVKTAASLAELRLEQLTSEEIREGIANGMSVVICLVGSIEQHGPHLPCETDCYYGLEMSLRVARRLGNALVAPVVRPGCSQHHLGFPGTISLPPDVLVSVVLEQLRCLIESGFSQIVLTSSHGGNFVPLRDATAEFEALCTAHQVRLVPVLDLQAWINALKVVPNSRGLRQQDMPAVQADLIETSLMLALYPDLVRKDRIERGYVGDFDLEGSFATHGLKALTNNGVLGDPTLATAELGDAIIAELADYLYDAVADHLEVGA
jgi:creatinine amidohydrolase